MEPSDYFPHVDLLLHSMRIDRNRLNSRSKVAIDAQVLRRLIQCAIERLPFSAEFYRETYPDIAAAAAAGQIADLHRHYVDTGYFEGRVGVPPGIDENYYRAAYQDVAEAIAERQVASAADHYMQAGAAEGRVPEQRLAGAVGQWMALLRMPVPGEI
ncbi:MAG: hypothetical protein ACLQMV_07530 [Rhodoblastus sp.]|uniref:hypothetical protein n=1 Tax=Rhodoblastus sp. TaxID=1962975 RepID=UPI003FD82CB7